MRLLLINPNSTEATTERIAATAKAAAAPGTQIDALTAASGIPAIETPEQSAQAEPAVLDLVAEPVEIQGEVFRRGNLHYLRADPATYRRLETGF